MRGQRKTSPASFLADFNPFFSLPLGRCLGAPWAGAGGGFEIRVMGGILSVERHLSTNCGGGVKGGVDPQGAYDGDDGGNEAN